MARICGGLIAAGADTHVSAALLLPLLLPLCFCFQPVSPCSQHQLSKIWQKTLQEVSNKYRTRQHQALLLLLLRAITLSCLVRAAGMSFLE